jgi:hypothetical protein
MANHLKLLLLAWALALPSVQGAGALYQNDFEKAALDSMPEEFLVLDGAFAVKEAGGNKSVELPGAPLDTFGFLFGPAQVDGVAVSARIKSEGKGRRFPAFAVGLGGVGGYRLQVSAAKKAVEIFKADEPAAMVSFNWESGAWHHLKLQLRKVKEGQWIAEGRVWKDGTPEPKEWTITHPITEEPPSGRPTVWGNPFAGTPIHFDDLLLAPIAP